MVKIKWHDYKMDPFPGCCQIIVLNRLRGAVGPERNDYEHAWANATIGWKADRKLNTDYYEHHASLDTLVDAMAGTGVEYEADLVFSALLSKMYRGSTPMVYMSDNYHPDGSDKHDGPVSIREFVQWIQEFGEEFPGKIVLLEEYQRGVKDLKVWSLHLDYKSVWDFLDPYQIKTREIYNNAVLELKKKKEANNGSKDKEPEAEIEVGTQPREVSIDNILDEASDRATTYYVAYDLPGGFRRARR